MTLTEHWPATKIESTETFLLSILKKQLSPNVEKVELGTEGIDLKVSETGEYFELDINFIIFYSNNNLESITPSTLLLPTNTISEKVKDSLTSYKWEVIKKHFLRNESITRPEKNKKEIEEEFEKIKLKVLNPKNKFELVSNSSGVRIKITGKV